MSHHHLKSFHTLQQSAHGKVQANAHVMVSFEKASFKVGTMLGTALEK